MNKNATLFRHWDGLNHIYGVVEVIRDLTNDLKAVLEFEPGLYSHTQVKDTTEREDNEFLSQMKTTTMKRLFR